MGFWKDLCNAIEEGKDLSKLKKENICYWPKSPSQPFPKRDIRPEMVDEENESCTNTADNQKQVLEDVSLKLYKCLSDIENKSNIKQSN